MVVAVGRTDGENTMAEARTPVRRQGKSLRENESGLR